MIEWQTHLTIENRELAVTVQAEGHVYDENYGADADGNRGEWRTFVDDLEVTIKDMRGNDITDKVFKKYRTEFDAVEEAAIEQLIENHSEGGSCEPEDYDER